MSVPGPDDTVLPPLDTADLLEACRRREKAQTLFYRALAAQASASGDADATERLNELHADEQHHLSRLTARLLELGRAPSSLDGVVGPAGVLAHWEGDARARETDEVAWYQQCARVDLDPHTAALVAEILESERHHAQELRGKWMRA